MKSYCTYLLKPKKLYSSCRRFLMLFGTASGQLHQVLLFVTSFLTMPFYKSTTSLHTLDLIITNSDNCVRNLTIHSSDHMVISNHFILTFYLSTLHHPTLAICQSNFMIILRLITMDCAPIFLTSTSLHVFCRKLLNQCGTQSKMLSMKVWPSSSPKWDCVTTSILAGSHPNLDTYPNVYILSTQEII